MVRALIFAGLLLGIASAFPILFQKDPDGFASTVRSWLASGETDDDAGREGSPASTGQETHSRAPSGRKIAIPASANGHFLADFRLNGRRERAMVDTGATLVAMNEDTARRIGLHVAASDFTHRVTTANGAAKAALARLDRLEIGRIHVEDVDALVLDDDALDGVLVGMSFLGRLSRYRVEGGELILEQ